jgi:hypothetical protein
VSGDYKYDVAEHLLGLSSPHAEIMSDGARLTEFCVAGYRAVKEIERLREEVACHEASFDATWAAQMRGVKLWREAAPGRELTLPDAADFTAWLLDQLEEAQKKGAA